MINSRLSLILLFVLCLFQLGFVSNMIRQQNLILKQGTEYRFKTRPIDPYDPFRGRYITLNFEQERQFTLPLTDDANLRNKIFYALLSEDSLGFAQIDSILLHQPESEHYLITSGWTSSSMNKIHSNTKDSVRVFLNLPFNRYYMEESKAPDAELLFRNLEMDSIPKATYAVVSIWKGKPSLKDVIVDSLSINEWVEKQMN